MQRAVQMPQRSNGKLRVAAILEAAEAVIAERGYEAATMAEIAARSATKIGSLYRFFPNKESLADTMVVAAREDLDAAFAKLDATVGELSIAALAEQLISLLFEPVFSKRALMKLLDAGAEWSAKREEFRAKVLQHIAETLLRYRPSLSREAATDVALVLLLSTKGVATQQGPGSRAADEFRQMIRLYLQEKLG